MKSRMAAAVVALCLFFAPAAAPVAAQTPPAPPIAAAAGVLVDAATGEVLWEKDSLTQRPVASLTKILTGYLVVTRTEMGELVTISDAVEQVGESDPLVTELELQSGTQVPVLQLVYGLMLESANDAALALAEHIAGSQREFAALMNQTARDLGAKGSRFANPHGLDEPGHHSTAADMAIITRAALKDELLAGIVATPSWTVILPEQEPRLVVNRNELLGILEGADGVKTGQTLVAGKSLVASATRSGNQRIAVVLNSPNPPAEASALIEYGFAAFTDHQIAQRNTVWGQLTYGNGSTMDIVPRSDVKAVVPAGVRPPAASYHHQRKILQSQGAEIAVDLKCPQQGCAPRSGNGGFLVLVHQLAAPVLTLFLD